MLSTLKLVGVGGMTARAASATRPASKSSDPYCFDAMAGFSAVLRDAIVRFFGRECEERARGEDCDEFNECLLVESQTIELTLKFVCCFSPCQFVPLDNFARVQAHEKQALSLLQKLSS